MYFIFIFFSTSVWLGHCRGIEDHFPTESSKSQCDGYVHGTICWQVFIPFRACYTVSHDGSFPLHPHHLKSVVNWCDLCLGPERQHITDSFGKASHIWRRMWFLYRLAFILHVFESLGFPRNNTDISGLILWSCAPLILYWTIRFRLCHFKLHKSNLCSFGHIWWSINFCSTCLVIIGDQKDGNL